MDVKDAIEARRSIRKYQTKAVTKDIIKEVINAGRLAATGTNAQPIRYYVITKSEMIEKLRYEGAFIQDFFYLSPVIICLAGDPTVYHNSSGVMMQQSDGTLPTNLTEVKSVLSGREEIRAIRDIAIASSFMVLRATELGLGSCWVGLIRPEAFRKVLGIPEEFVIPFVLVLGYPDESPPPRPRKKLEDLILKWE